MEKIQLKENMPQWENCGFYKMCLEKKSKDAKYVMTCETGIICPMFFTEASLGLDRYKEL